jgi:hypothetical protein
MEIKLEVERILLEKVRLGVRREISPEMAAELTIERFLNYESDAVVYAFRALVTANKIREETQSIIVTYHSWWDNFKDVLPSWVKKHLRINKEETPSIIKHYHLCPHVNQKSDEIVHIDFLKGEEGI